MSRRTIRGLKREAPVFAAEEAEPARRPEEVADLQGEEVQEQREAAALAATTSTTNQMSEPFKLVPSQQGFLLNVGGYLLAKNRQVGDVVYWHCIQRRSGPCPAFAKTTIVGGNHWLNRHGQHNHMPNPVETTVRRARAAIRQRARDTSDTPTQIIQDVTSMMPTTSAVHMPNRPALRQAIRRARRPADRVIKPASLDQVDVPEALRSVNGQRFLGRDTTTRVGQDRILLFSTEQNLQKLQEAPYWIMEGTFQTCPIIFQQIYTIHAMVGTNPSTQRFLPLVYGLLSSKGEECYEQFFESLVDYAADFNIDLAPLFVITDFERSAINALMSTFPETRHQGCFFHLGQNLWRKIQLFGLSGQYELDKDFQLKMKQLQALAFLPADKIPDAFNQLKDLMPANAAAVIKYFEETYVLGRLREQTWWPIRSPPMFPPEMWSVYESTDHGLLWTQNQLEGWHQRWNVLLDHRKYGVYKVIGHFIKEQKTTIINLERIAANVPHTPMKQELRSQEEAIRTCVMQIDQMDTMDYLRGIAHQL